MIVSSEIHGSNTGLARTDFIGASIMSKDLNHVAHIHLARSFVILESHSPQGLEVIRGIICRRKILWLMQMQVYVACEWCMSRVSG